MDQTLIDKLTRPLRSRTPVKAAREVDPLTLSTVWHGLQRICREMRRVIERTSQSYLISQLKDISVGIWDGEGHTVAIPIGLATQFVGGKFSVRYILNEYRNNVYPGDIFLANDPYNGYSCHPPDLGFFLPPFPPGKGGLLGLAPPPPGGPRAGSPPDWGFFRPIFHQGKVAFWTLARAHVEDTGAAFPGAYFSDPYDIHSEGILIPGVKVVEKGKEQRDILRLIWNNVRLAEGVKIDCYAMIAATEVAHNRLTELVGRYGIKTVMNCIAVMQQRTERAVRACIKEMKDGTYYGESSTDDDGYELDVPVTVCCEATID